MKIERKESNGLVEFGSLKCGDVFVLSDDLFMKLDNYNTNNNAVFLPKGQCINIIDKSLKVKPYSNAKLVLED